jgi:AraC-like DNA-binding protein/ligand-binding sensor protein
MPHTIIPPDGAATASQDPAHTTDRNIVPHLQRSEVFRDYVKAFETTTGLPLALRQTGSFHSPLHQSKQVNAFCTLMAGRNQTCAACLRLQQHMETTAVADPQTAECFAGLTESAVPVRVGEQVLGHLQTGQVLLHAPTKAGLKRILRQLEEWKLVVDPVKLAAAYFGSRVVNRKQYESIVRLVAVFAQHLGTLSNQVLVTEALAEPPAITRARAFIAEHKNEEISLNDVARAVNMSGFYFCKVFKRATGLTFTDYLARTRIEAVKDMLLNPHVRISEAAYACGFQSLSQFNRVFRRIAGEAPTAYRERLHGGTTAITSGTSPRGYAHAA